MGDENGRAADGEFGVVGLVVKGIHTQEHADAAAKQGRADQGPLGDAPAVIPGFYLVMTHKYECSCID